MPVLPEASKFPLVIVKPSAMVTAPFSDTAPELVAKVPVLAEASKAPLDNVKPSAAVTAPFNEIAPELVWNVPVLAEASKLPPLRVKPLDTVRLSTVAVVKSNRLAPLAESQYA